MNRDEQTLITDLFGKLAQAERTAPPRDADAERVIAESVQRQPGAPYYMAQTIIIQEQALEAAQQRIQALEATQSQGSGGGFFGSLFGGGSRQAPQRPAAPPVHGRAPQPAGAWNTGGAQGGYGQQPGGYAQPSRGGGFMAGAAQTAMGVAGGVVLGSLISDAFFGDDPAAAAADAGGGEEVADAGAAEAGGFEEASFDDGGGDFGGFDDV